MENAFAAFSPRNAQHQRPRGCPVSDQGQICAAEESDIATPCNLDNGASGHPNIEDALSNKRNRLLARQRAIVERLRIHLEGLLPNTDASAEAARRLADAEERALALENTKSQDR